MVRASAHTRLLNFTSNIVSLAVFAVAGYVLVVPGLLMGAGQMLGARLGAGLAVKRGARFIRPVFLAVVILTTLNLVWRQFG